MDVWRIQILGWVKFPQQQFPWATKFPLKTYWPGKFSSVFEGKNQNFHKILHNLKN